MKTCFVVCAAFMAVVASVSSWRQLDYRQGCFYSHGLECGGRERGRCIYGECVCNDGYVGDACECSTSVDECTSYNGLICNGKGTCQCDVCVCEQPYAGKTCENCPTCVGRCQRLKDCVSCLAYGEGPLSEDECCLNCDQVKLLKVKNLKHGNSNYPLCIFATYQPRDHSSCLLEFTYNRSGSEVEVPATRECSQN